MATSVARFGDELLNARPPKASIPSETELGTSRWQLRSQNMLPLMQNGDNALGCAVSLAQRISREVRWRKQGARGGYGWEVVPSAEIQQSLANV